MVVSCKCMTEYCAIILIKSQVFCSKCHDGQSSLVSHSFSHWWWAWGYGAWLWHKYCVWFLMMFSAKNLPFCSLFMSMVNKNFWSSFKCHWCFELTWMVIWNLTWLLLNLALFQVDHATVTAAEGLVNYRSWFGLWKGMGGNFWTMWEEFDWKRVYSIPSLSIQQCLITFIMIDQRVVE